MCLLQRIEKVEIPAIDCQSAQKADNMRQGAKNVQKMDTEVVN